MLLLVLFDCYHKSVILFNTGIIGNVTYTLLEDEANYHSRSHIIMYHCYHPPLDVKQYII